MQASSTNKRLISLDALRGVAALSVALAHYSFYSDRISVGPISAGVFVAFFFMLSGYVLTHAYGEKIRSEKIDITQYFVKRFARLYPLHITTFFFVAIYGLAMSFARYLFQNAGYGAEINVPSQNNSGLLEIFENITLTQQLFVGHNSYNAPSWTIGIEFWGGFSLFFLCLPRRILIKTLFIAIILVIFILTEINGGFLNAETQWIYGIIEKNYSIALFCFLSGWSLYHFQRYLHGKFNKVPQAFSWLIVGFIFYFTYFPPIDVSEHPLVEIAYFVAFGIVIFLVRNSYPKNKFLTWLMQTSGNLSFGIYLWHIPLLLTITATSRLSEVILGISLMNNFAMDVSFICFLLVISSASYRWLEVPSKSWLLNKAKEKRFENLHR